MHRTLSKWKSNQGETPQIVHNGIHTPTPDPTPEIIKPIKNSEIFPNLHSSLISIGQLCDDECIVTFDKHKVIVSKTNDIFLEGYWDPANRLWRFPLHHTSQNNKQVNILETHLCNPIRPMAPRYPRSYLSKSQQYLAIFYYQILCCTPNAPFSRQSRMDTSQHVQDSQRN